ncbi:MAG TPA: hypothetical protein PLN99_16025, partial [Daejeonella sp.]|nr:hypothetical protein [Daejeonella sp.]
LDSVTISNSRLYIFKKAPDFIRGFFFEERKSSIRFYCFWLYICLNQLIKIPFYEKSELCRGAAAGICAGFWKSG